jgi:hypothetical protein
MLTKLTNLAERGGLPCVFRVDAECPRVDAECPTIPFWLANPEKAPTEAYVTARQLKDWIELHGNQTVAKQIIAKCYVPRADAIMLLRDAGVELLPTWATGSAPSSAAERTTIISSRQSEAPKRQNKNVPVGAYKAYAIDFFKRMSHHPRRVDDEEWRRKKGYTRDSAMNSRRQYKATLSPDEETKFGRPGPKRR